MCVHLKCRASTLYSRQCSILDIFTFSVHSLVFCVSVFICAKCVFMLSFIMSSKCLRILLRNGRWERGREEDKSGERGLPVKRASVKRQVKLLVAVEKFSGTRFAWKSISMAGSFVSRRRAYNSHSLCMCVECRVWVMLYVSLSGSE